MTTDLPRLGHWSLIGYFEKMQVDEIEVPEVWALAGGEIPELWTEGRQMEDEVGDFVHWMFSSAIPRQ